MNPKIEKISGEVEKTKAKIAELQARLRELERQRTELENAEIVAIFRKEKLTEDDFSTFVKQMRAHTELPAAPFAYTPAYQPKLEEPKNEE